MDVSLQLNVRLLLPGLSRRREGFPKLGQVWQIKANPNGGQQHHLAFADVHARDRREWAYIVPPLVVKSIRLISNFNRKLGGVV